MNALNINSSHSPSPTTKFSVTHNQPTYLHNLCSVHWWHPSSTICITSPVESAPFFTPSTVNLIPFTDSPYPVHITTAYIIEILFINAVISPYHSHYLHPHHLSLPQPFTIDLKLITFTKFLHSIVFVLFDSFRTAFTNERGH